MKKLKQLSLALVFAFILVFNLNIHRPEDNKAGNFELKDIVKMAQAEGETSDTVLPSSPSPLPWPF